jgi:hypothetical protein
VIQLAIEVQPVLSNCLAVRGEVAVRHLHPLGRGGASGSELQQRQIAPEHRLRSVRPDSCALDQFVRADQQLQTRNLADHRPEKRFDLLAGYQHLGFGNL